MINPSFGSGAWDEGDHIVYIMGGSVGRKSTWDIPLGKAMSPKDAKIVAAWLNEGGYRETCEVLRAVEKQEEKGGSDV